MGNKGSKITESPVFTKASENDFKVLHSEKSRSDEDKVLHSEKSRSDEDKVIPDDVALSFVFSSRKYPTAAKGDEWKKDRQYAVGDLVTYADSFYTCTMGHVSYGFMSWGPPPNSSIWRQL